MSDISDKPKENIETPKVTDSPKKLTPNKGMAAMAGEEVGENKNIQGSLKEKTSELKKDQAVEGESVKTPVPVATLIGQMPPMTASEAEDLSISAEHANLTKATRFHAENGGHGSIYEYHRIRSEISEDLASYQVESAARADHYSVGGHNFPGYDVLGTNEVSSVKCYSVKSEKNGELQPRFGSYQTEFMNIMQPDSKANQKAAERFLQIRENSPDEWEKLKNHLPKSVLEAKNPEEMAKELAACSTMRIPQDQVSAVAQNLTAYYKNKLMREKNMTESEAISAAQAEVSKRILSIDPRYQTAHYQGMAAKILSDRLNLD